MSLLGFSCSTNSLMQRQDGQQVVQDTDIMATMQLHTHFVRAQTNQ